MVISSKQTMEQDATVAFCVPSLCGHINMPGFERNLNEIESSLLPSLSYTCDKMMIGSRSLIQVAGSPVNRNRDGIRHDHYNISIVGPSSQAFQIKSQLETAHIFRTCDIIAIPHSLVAYIEKIKERTGDLLTSTDSTISVESFISSPMLNEADNQSSLQKIVITGPFEEVSALRLQCFVLFDELLGNIIDTLNLDIRLINILGGPERKIFEKIMRETGASIYAPKVFLNKLLGVGSISSSSSPILPSTNIVTSIDTKEMGLVFITGSAAAVKEARKSILEEYNSKKDIIISKSFTLLSKKISWITKWRYEDFNAVMIKYGTFVKIAELDSSNASITVYGTNQSCLEFTINDISQMAYHYHIANFWLKDGILNKEFCEGISKELCSISQKTNSEITFSHNLITFGGSQQSIQDAFNLIYRSERIQKNLIEVKYQIQESFQIKEFISGKKDGKINKIMKSTGTTVLVQNYHERDIIVELIGTDSREILYGTKLLNGEFPAEISFYIPENHHKRIIGHGGKNIQRIMKKYGVYIKFLSLEESKLKFGDPLHFMKKPSTFLPNVIVKTPSKNQDALVEMKKDILELSNEQDVVASTTAIKLSKVLHTWFSCQRIQPIEAVETLTQTEISFPPRESNSEDVMVKGRPGKVETAIRLLYENLPKDYLWNVPLDSKLASILTQEEFKKTFAKITNDTGVSLLVPNTKLLDKTELFCLVFRTSVAQFQKISEVQKALSDYLKKKNIPKDRLDREASETSSSSYESQLQRSESLNSALAGQINGKFKHFNSILYSTDESKIQGNSFFEHKVMSEKLASLQILKHANSVPNMLDDAIISVPPKNGNFKTPDRWAESTRADNFPGKKDFSVLDHLEFMKGRVPIFSEFAQDSTDKSPKKQSKIPGRFEN